MLNAPKSLKTAKLHKYGQWAGKPSGEKYDPDCCAWEVFGKFITHQCTRRKPSRGPAGLYCWQHADKAKRMGTVRRW